MNEVDAGAVKAWAYVSLLTVVAGNVLGNFFMKLGATPRAGSHLLFGIFGWPTLVGILFYGSGVLLYAWALKYVELNTAQAIVSLQFAGAIFVASLYFGEAISFHRWIGLGLIFLGLLICSR